MSDVIKFAICDDSHIERRIIKKILDTYIDEHEYNVLVEEFASGDELLSADVSEYDLLILDIYMSGLNGIETAKEMLEKHPKCKVILCSSSNEFAEESYDVQAFRYLLKPISKEKMYQSLDKFFWHFTEMQVLEYRYQRTTRKILLKDVMWIEAARKHAIIHTEKEEIETSNSLSDFSEKLRGNGFIKPIRYALVSLKAVEEVNNDTVVLKDGTEIAIGRENKKEIQDAFMNAFRYR